MCALKSSVIHGLTCVLYRCQERANARVNVSESIPGNPERILSVSGPLETVSKVSEEST